MENLIKMVEKRMKKMERPGSMHAITDVAETIALATMPEGHNAEQVMSHRNMVWCDLAISMWYDSDDDVRREAIKFAMKCSNKRVRR